MTGVGAPWGARRRGEGGGEGRGGRGAPLGELLVAPWGGAARSNSQLVAALSVLLPT
jgi:hypothetical protein